jgi:hypothetical protein
MPTLETKQAKRDKHALGHALGRLLRCEHHPRARRQKGIGALLEPAGIF